MDSVSALPLCLVQQQGFKSEDEALDNETSLVRGIKHQGKRVLDIGRGKGYQAAYVARRGAGLSVGLEPEAEGAIQGDPAVIRNPAGP
jgi:hypothetical protein